MAPQRGKDLLIKIGDGASSEAFTTVLGLRTKTVGFNKETVDITNSESAGQWRELLTGAGVRSASVTGAGVFKDDASAEQVRAAYFNDTIFNWQVIIPDFGTIEGLFELSTLEFNGEYNAEVPFNFSLESAGEITFTAAS